MNKKIIWITGASSGIGEATARKFAKEGWKVIVSARRVELLEKLSSDENIFSYPLDVTDQIQTKQVFEKIINDHKQIDLCIFKHRSLSFKKHGRSLFLSNPSKHY